MGNNELTSELNLDDYKSIVQSRLDILLAEYKEMRNEIRAAFSQYFSIFFGVIFTGIIITFKLAFDNAWLFLAIPFMIAGWISVIVIIRLNIQNIARYIKRTEREINFLLGDRCLDYESTYVKQLWFSWKVLCLAALPFIIIVGIGCFSIWMSYWVITYNVVEISGITGHGWAIAYVIFMCIVLIVLAIAFIVMPKKIYDHK